MTPAAARRPATSRRERSRSTASALPAGTAQARAASEQPAAQGVQFLLEDAAGGGRLGALEGIAADDLGQRVAAVDGRRAATGRISARRTGTPQPRQLQRSLAAGQAAADHVTGGGAALTRCRARQDVDGARPWLAAAPAALVAAFFTVFFAVVFFTALPAPAFFAVFFTALPAAFLP